MDPIKQVRKDDHSEDDSCSYSSESWHQGESMCCPYMKNCPLMFQSMPMQQMPMMQNPCCQMPMDQDPCGQMPYAQSKCGREDEDFENEMRSPRPDRPDYGDNKHHYYPPYYPPYYPWYNYPKYPYHKRPRPWWMY